MDEKTNLTNTYIQSLLFNLTDVCQFLLDNKAYINYEIVLKISSVNDIPPSIKNLFINTNLIEAIRNTNIYLITYLYNHNANSEKALIEAVKKNDPKIVEIVIKYFDF